MASPLSSSTGAAGWSRIAAARWTTVSTPAQRLAHDARVAELDQVAERDPHLDPQPPELARVADQHPDLVAALEQLRHQRLPDGPRRSGHQDHRRAL